MNDKLKRTLPTFSRAAGGGLIDRRALLLATPNAILDAATLPRIQMPNRKGFISAWPTNQSLASAREEFMPGTCEQAVDRRTRQIMWLTAIMMVIGILGGMLLVRWHC